jgi:hypothetical protein
VKGHFVPRDICDAAKTGRMAQVLSWQRFGWMIRTPQMENVALRCAGVARIARGSAAEGKASRRNRGMS